MITNQLVNSQKSLIYSKYKLMANVDYSALLPNPELLYPKKSLSVC